MDFGDCVLVARWSWNRSGFYRLVNRSTIPQLDVTATTMKLMKFKPYDVYVPIECKDRCEAVFRCEYNEHTGEIHILLMSVPAGCEDDIPKDTADKIVSSIFLDIYPVVRPYIYQLCSHMQPLNLIVKYDDFMNNYNNRVINDAAKTIQNKWKEARLNPYCRLGFNTVNHSYDSYLK
jgi:hypothetical protein